MLRSPPARLCHCGWCQTRGPCPQMLPRTSRERLPAAQVGGTHPEAGRQSSLEPMNLNFPHLPGTGHFYSCSDFIFMIWNFGNKEAFKLCNFQALWNLGPPSLSGEKPSLGFPGAARTPAPHQGPGQTRGRFQHLWPEPPGARSPAASPGPTGPEVLCLPQGQEAGVPTQGGSVYLHNVPQARRW